jgi:putative FmdB family regulatory protein
MPTYEYRCPKGHEFELFQRMSAETRAECPECGKVAERLLSGGAGLIFKGEGFYITDYRSEAYKKAASSDKEASGTGADSKKKSKDGAASSDGGSSKSKGASSDVSGKSDGSKSSDTGKSSKSDA